MKIRNIAIIAHVDHGKTTLVDELLKQSGTFRDNQAFDERVMDSNDLERERGITILSKCTSVFYKDYKINIIDTPGHADFGGEVERVLGMVEGVILLVDSQEGAMPQTRFVTQKALSLGLKPIVVINKMDKEGARPQEVCDEIFDLFVNLEANNEQLDFPILYAAARDGWVSNEETEKAEDTSALFETIISHVKEPKAELDKPFSMVCTMISNDNYVGKTLIGKVESGSLKVGDTVHGLTRDGDEVEKSKISKIMVYEGLAQKSVESVQAGEIVSIAGLTKSTVSDTICHLEHETALDAKPVDPPVLSMIFSVNNSPFAGKDGDKLTSRVIRDRLLKEQETNVSIKINETESAESFEVAGRGELQLAILIENMRREGFELLVGRPKVLVKEVDGKKQEPMETVQVDVDEDLSGTVIDTLQKRKALMENMQVMSDGRQRITFVAPTRGLIGYYSKFLTDTKGTGTMARIFHSYEDWKGKIDSRHKGVLLSMVQGKAVAYALFNLEDRGIMFISPQEEVYVGMIIGEHSKENDLEVNPIKGKQLTNMRASGKDESVVLTPAKKLSLEEAISYIQDDELIEVTPNHIRLRKKFLDPNERKRQSRKEQ